MRLQGLRHALIARDGVGFIVVVGINGVHAQLQSKARDELHRVAVQHNQPTSMGAQSRINLNERLIDEGDALVVTIF